MVILLILFIIIVLLLGIMTSFDFDEDFELKNTNFLVKHHVVLHYPLEPK